MEAASVEKDSLLSSSKLRPAVSLNIIPWICIIDRGRRLFEVPLHTYNTNEVRGHGHHAAPDSLSLRLSRPSVYVEFFLLWCSKNKKRPGRTDEGNSHQNTTFCCCTTEKCCSGQFIYCLIYFIRWWVGPNQIKPERGRHVISTFQAKFKRAFYFEWHKPLSLPLCLCGPCSLFAW